MAEPILHQLADQEIEAARTLIKNFANDAKTDGTLAAYFKNDPVAALTAAGVPEFARCDVLREEGIADDLGVLCEAGCWVTCACSDCCVSL